MADRNTMISAQLAQYRRDLHRWSTEIQKSPDLTACLRTAAHKPVPGAYLRSVSSAHLEDLGIHQRVIDAYLVGALRAVQTSETKRKILPLLQRLTWATDAMRWAVKARAELAASNYMGAH